MKLDPILSRLGFAAYSNVQSASVSTSLTKSRLPTMAGCDPVAVLET